MAQLNIKQTQKSSRERSTYRVSLKEQMACCEANYLRLLKLMPDFDESNEWLYETSIGDRRFSLLLDVTERAPYTTMVNVEQCSGVSDWCLPPRLQVRMYHDVNMAEVIAWGKHRRLQVRYDYPNTGMYQQDEKAQLNVYLADCLKQVLAHGHMPVKPDTMEVFGGSSELDDQKSKC